VALKTAFQTGKIDSCISLLTHGAQLPRDGLFADSDNNNLLHLVLGKADVVTPACISAILKSRPLLVQAPNNANEMPVQVAVSSGVSLEIKLITKLLQANPQHGATALKTAFETGQIDSCISLLTYGAQLPRDGLFTDSYNNNLLHLVLSKADVVTPACISAILKSRPSFVQTPNNANEMPVQVAVCNGVSLEIILMLLDAHPLSPSQRRLLSRAAASSSYRNEIEFLVRSFSFNEKVQIVNVHLVGHGLSGKTTVRQALRHALNSSIVSWLFCPSTVKPIDISDRTIGLEIEKVVSNKNVCYIIHDFGGQDRYHVNHCPFLSKPNSMFVLVVSMWDFEHNVEFSDEDITDRCTYWLDLIDTVANKQAKVNIIIIINDFIEVLIGINIIIIIKEIYCY
jgi:hypothetical protein